MNKVRRLSEIQKNIKKIDNTILAELSKRQTLEREIADNQNIDLTQFESEEWKKELLKSLIERGKEHQLDEDFIANLYSIIINNSIQLQKQHRQEPDTSTKTSSQIAYLGSKGSYSHYAAFTYCQKHNIEMKEINCQSFDDIINQVSSGNAQYGFLPIENTSSGSINEVFDLLQHTSLMIVGETTIDVSHCLLAKPDTAKTDIQMLFAHPQPISQCSQYLSQFPNIKIEYCASSADAMTKVKNNNKNNVAAIGSAYGAKFYELKTLDENLANQQINQTRFIMVAPKSVSVGPNIAAKTSLIIATTQKPGALVDALSVFKSHQLNMSKLESRPIMGKPWQEMFYLDIEVNISDTRMVNALAELSKLTRFIKILGCYPIMNAC